MPVNKEFSKCSPKRLGERCSYATGEKNRFNREKVYIFVLNKKINGIKIIHTDKSKNYASLTLVSSEIEIL